MNPEKIQLIYWISTGLLCAIMLWSAYTYFFQQEAITGFRALGFPDYFRIQLGILKILAVIVLLWPAMPIRIKEWAYAGIGFFLLTALIAHLVHKDGILITGILLVFMVVLASSYWSVHQLSV